MDNNEFGESAKERLEKEIEELKRQKEIQDLKKQKEELEKTIYGSVAGSSAQNTDRMENSTRKTNIPKETEQENDEEIEEKYISNRMTTILAAVAAIFIVVVGSGIFYLRSQNKKKKENLKKEMAAVSQNQNIPTVTAPQTSETVQQEQKKEEKPKTEEKKETPKESNEKLVVRSPVGVKKGSYCVNPNPAESAFGTDTVDDSFAEHGYMADIAFENCVINSGGSVKNTGPVTITVSLAEEKNYDAVMNRNKWYLENGQINRISGRDSSFLYFNGWLMYKQSN